MYFEEKLLGLQFEQILFFLNDITRTTFYSNKDLFSIFLRDIHKIKISSELLSMLENEYTQILQKSIDHFQKRKKVYGTERKMIRVKEFKSEKYFQFYSD